MSRRVADIGCNVGFVGADLEALTKEAAAIAIARIFRTMESKITCEQPSHGNHDKHVGFLFKAIHIRVEKLLCICGLWS